ncbi:MAG TPA: hypothetical protein VGG99_20255 [Acetobacteraceae bacterium]|jgi:hypothetical protein
MMRSNPGDDDDTVKLRPASMRQPSRSSRLPLALAAAAGGAVVVAAAAWLLWPHSAPPAPPAAPAPVARTAKAPIAAPPAPMAQRPAPPEFAIQTADEQQIRDDVPTGMTVFRFAADQRIVVLDFASLHEQGMMLNRVAALIEKGATPRDRVLTEDQLNQAIHAGGDTVSTYYYGHDYSVAELVRFFALADSEHVQLYPEEEKLRRLVRQLGWFLPEAEGGLISIPKVGANARVTYEARSAILHHELSHGEYFSNPTYVAYVHEFWEHSLSHIERQGVRKFLASEEYDPSLGDLMQNEMQAYLMFTRDPLFFTAADIGMPPTRLATLQAEFDRNLPVGWLHQMMDEPLAVQATVSK